MEWVLRSPHVHSVFESLGFLHSNGYHINENCNEALETILCNISVEDKYLRTYRRNISFGQKVQKDLIPLLIHAKDDKTIELLIKILLNLTIPIECLVSLDSVSKSDFGRHTIFELNNLLQTTKAAFTDNRTTKVIIDFIKKNLDNDQDHENIPSDNCTNISNSLLLLRNILHIPYEVSTVTAGHSASEPTIQNQILWNIFSQSVDKILIKLMVIPESHHWGVTMVQLIALLYKDQHVVTLHKLLNLWLESSISESSEDNESNTSPPDQGSEDSSPMLTSDPTSDSSDTGASGKSNDGVNSEKNTWRSCSEIDDNTQTFVHPGAVTSINRKKSNKKHTELESDNVNTSCHDSDIALSSNGSGNNVKKTSISDNSDCGYVTQIENQGSISTSSNEDELPAQKPVHQKPHNPKQRVNSKSRPGTTLQERKRKKIVKRGKVNIINVQGLSHKTPTDYDITIVLKEFTVDFLLKGYNSLVHTLHEEILNNLQLEIDTSHFFWLVTYFLKFATQIELDLEHVCSILSFEIVSYLTAQGVYLCEQFELAIKLDGNDLKPCMRRLHLVVTALRELIQAVDVYQKLPHVSNNDKTALEKLQLKICEIDELRSLMVLLLRHYNPKYHTKQYLQDLVVTNHILLLFMDKTMKLSSYKGTTNMLNHIRQFATPEIMHQYGLLLEDYEGNGEFVNDCVFTLMHHVGGELGCLISLFQPNILKTFTSIWKSEFEICDDWSDLIECVINTFIRKPQSSHSVTNFRLHTENFNDDPDDNKPFPITITKLEKSHLKKGDTLKESKPTIGKETWTDEELSSLNWNYMQCSNATNMIGEIINMYKEEGVIKSRISVIKELYRQNIIDRVVYETYAKEESDKSSKRSQSNKENRDDDMGKLCEQLIQDGKLKFLDWVQKVLLDTCFVKIYLEKKSQYDHDKTESKIPKDLKTLTFELYKRKLFEVPVMSPVLYHSLLSNQSVPLVPWNCEQARICKDLNFLQLLHKLGFHMPVDSGKVFIRIPNVWTAVFLYEVASKILPIDQGKLPLYLSELSETVANKSAVRSEVQSRPVVDSCYRVTRPKHITSMVNFTPMPGPSVNSDAMEEGVIANGINKLNWLDLVPHSQECISLNINGIIDGENNTVNLEKSMHLTNDDCSIPPIFLESKTTPVNIIDPESGLIPGTPFIIQGNSYSDVLPEEESDVCETASVASDLTRMYVSDEDEKPEVLVRPTTREDFLIVEHADANVSDTGDNSGGKRPRVD